MDLSTPRPTTPKQSLSSASPSPPCGGAEWNSRGPGAWSLRGPWPSAPEALRPGWGLSSWLTVVTCTPAPPHPPPEKGVKCWLQARHRGGRVPWEMEGRTGPRALGGCSPTCSPRVGHLQGACLLALPDEAPIAGTPPWAAPSSQHLRAAPILWAGAERCGLDSISLSGLPSGR